MGINCNKKTRKNLNIISFSRVRQNGVIIKKKSCKFSLIVDINDGIITIMLQKGV